MNYLLWHRDGDARVASPNRVLRAAELPLLHDALALRDRLQALHDGQADRLAQALEQAREQGHAQGLAEGRAEARDEAAQALLALHQRAEQQHQALREQLLPLALQVAHKLLGNLPPEQVLAGLASQALDDLLPAPGLTLWVHPDHAGAVQRELQARRWPGQVRADPEATPGTCRLETEHGSVDASLATQMAQLQRLAAPTA